MALMQYAESFFRRQEVHKDTFGVFCIGRICFSFPKGDEQISIILSGVNVETVRKKAPSILPKGMSDQMLLKDNDAGFACFVIHSTAFLGQAAIYIQQAYWHYMCSRQIPPERGDVN
jgi:hypothetical protein